MLVLLKTAFYVAGWVMGVNGFGKRRVFFFFFGAKYIAQFHPVTLLIPWALSLMPSQWLLF